MEMLSLIIEKALLKNHIGTPFRQGNISITHLLFADDLMLFLNGDLSSAKGILSCLKNFSKITGLEANLDKSEVFFSGTDSRTKRSILEVLKIREARMPIRYLGIPLFTSNLRAQDCWSLTGKIRRRISSWSSSHLSQAGRVELIKTVINSFQVFWASAFNLPKGVIHCLEKICRAFLWGHDPSQKKFHSTGWNDFCKPKGEGGAGIRKIEDINNAFQLKILWNSMQDKNSLWLKWFKAKYVKRKNFWTMKFLPKPSWGVRGMFKARSLGMPFICYNADNEEEIELWDQPWHPHGVLSSVFSRSCTDSSLASAKFLSQIHSANGWAPFLSKPSLSEVFEFLKKGSFNCNGRNRVIWKPTSAGLFTT
ncbi:uncharacterized protein LOC143853893 [Tasmannia lanceolata]|uniref:uncharacterized protein LOC143853893 n=1 Tax=Tasmannia lanceolata TaxID=3420 RepID=UPI0040640612